MKKLIFLDLDGTLWNNEKVPLSALSAILQAGSLTLPKIIDFHISPLNGLFLLLF